MATPRPPKVVLSERERAELERLGRAFTTGQLREILVEVITLRDIDGWSAAEVCNVPGLTDTNQRVLLHRARSPVRAALERYSSYEP